jgi:hypothetical protein
MGEHVVTVLPLPVPDAGTPFSAQVYRRYPVLALFVARARTVAPRFTLTADTYPAVAQICRRLDGLPLAIELAASALRSHTVDQLAANLRDRLDVLPEADRPAARHATLDAAVGWSFELCSPAERLLWARACVFAGGFELNAAERVCADHNLPAGEILPVLAGLIDKSVIHLGALDEPTLRARHLDHYLRLAEQFHADWFGPDQPDWARRLRADLPNFRAALDHCLTDNNRPQSGLRLAGALYFFWLGCGETAEGRYWLHRALAAEPHPDPHRARALAAFSRLLIVESSSAAAAQPARECLDLARQFDQPLLVIDSLQCLGLALLYGGQRKEALAPLREALDRARNLDPLHPALARAQQHLAVGMLLTGNAVQARDLAAEAEHISRSHGERWWLSLAQLVGAAAALGLGDQAQARTYASQSLECADALGDRLGAGAALEFLAWIAAADQDHVAAARLLGAADRQWHDSGGSPFHADPWHQRRHHSETATRQALGDISFTAEYHQGRDLNLAQATAYAQHHQRNRPTA